MKLKEIIEKAHGLSKPFLVSDGENFRLKDIDPESTLEFTSEDKPRAKEALAMGVEALAEPARQVVRTGPLGACC